MKCDQGVDVWVVQNAEPLIVKNVYRDPRFYEGFDLAFGMVSENILAVPMICRQKMIGAIELVNKRNGGEFTESDATILSLLAIFAATSLDQLERQLELEEAGS